MDTTTMDMDCDPAFTTTNDIKPGVPEDDGDKEVTKKDEANKNNNRLELSSPFLDESKYFSLPLEQDVPILCGREDEDAWHHRGREIVRCIHHVCQIVPEIKDAMEGTGYQYLTEEDFALMDPEEDETVAWLKKYNAAVKGYRQRRQAALPSLLAPIVGVRDRGLLKHVLQQAYSRSVSEPRELNKFKLAVEGKADYGEVSFETICACVERLGPVFNEHRFVDLGSGVGQVVLQVAGMVQCAQVVGIEIGETRARYAEDMVRNFEEWMRFFGKSFSPVRLIRGDFLDPDHRHLLQGKTLLFLNNLTFSTELNNALERDVFPELDDGSKIISSSRIVQQKNFQITTKNLGEIGCILRTFTLLEGSVSWTRTSVPFFLQEVDRGKLERFFEKLQRVVQGEKKEGGLDIE